MERAELYRYKALLEKKYEELKQTVQKREGITIERAADIIDELQSVVERERAITTLDRFTRQLREVEAALSRIREGTFGYCVECEEPISVTRLKAVPWASLCLRCQQAADARDVEQHRPLLGMVGRAA
jgi:DnaK suppressor protein